MSDNTRRYIVFSIINSKIPTFFRGRTYRLETAGAHQSFDVTVESVILRPDPESVLEVRVRTRYFEHSNISAKVWLRKDGVWLLGINSRSYNQAEERLREREDRVRKTFRPLPNISG